MSRLNIGQALALGVASQRTIRQPVRLRALDNGRRAAWEPERIAELAVRNGRLALLAARGVHAGLDRAAVERRPARKLEQRSRLRSPPIRFLAELGTPLSHHRLPTCLSGGVPLDVPISKRSRCTTVDVSFRVEDGAAPNTSLAGTVSPVQFGRWARPRTPRKLPRVSGTVLPTSCNL